MAGRLLVALAGCAVLVTGASASPPLRLTETGVGQLQLGRPLASVGSRWIGPTGPGCELAAPTPVVARLKAPLAGSAAFSGAARHRLVALWVTRGAATDRGIAIGATAAAVRRAYPGAVAQDSEQPLRYHALTVRRNGKDRIWFMLDRRNGRVTAFALPAPQFCE
jgi:hypothetical protein